MKEKLKGPKVEDVSIAAVHEMGEEGTMVYNIYLINLKSESLEQVLVTSKGYSTSNEVKTTTLRRLLGNIDPKTTVKIEPIIEEVFGLNNEYWVSFWIGEILYDKKFIFLPESIKQEHFTIVPILNKSGVIIG